MADKSIWWDIKQTLSYNSLLNAIVGSRGTGKTHGCKRWCVDDYLKDGSQFVWCRRYDTEFDDFRTVKGPDGFFADLRIHYPKYGFKYIGYIFYIGNIDPETGEVEKIDDKEVWSVLGFGIPLSLSAKKKSTSYPDVNKLIMDEFIIPKGRSNYLQNEVTIFLDLCETVFRMREPKAIFLLANAITFTNPYFLYFNVNKPLNKKGISKQGDFLIQLVNNESFIETKKATRFGKLIAGTDYGNYAIDNMFMLDSEQFIIGKGPENRRYFFTIKAVGEHYGVWMCDDLGFMFVSSKSDPSCKVIYTTLLENHEPNTMLLKSGGNSPVFMSLVNAFKNGNCRFDCVKTKNIILDTMRGTL